VIGRLIDFPDSISHRHRAALDHDARDLGNRHFPTFTALTHGAVEPTSNQTKALQLRTTRAFARTQYAPARLTYHASSFEDNWSGHHARNDWV
jgi:hypothetical protein